MIQFMGLFYYFSERQLYYRKNKSNSHRLNNLEILENWTFELFMKEWNLMAYFNYMYAVMMMKFYCVFRYWFVEYLGVC